MLDEALKLVISSGVCSAASAVLTRLYTVRSQNTLREKREERDEMREFRTELRDELRQLKAEHKEAMEETYNLQQRVLALTGELETTKQALAREKLFTVEQDEEIKLKEAQLVLLRDELCRLRDKCRLADPDGGPLSAEAGPVRVGGAVIE